MNAYRLLIEIQQRPYCTLYLLSISCGMSSYYYWACSWNAFEIHQVLNWMKIYTLDMLTVWWEWWESVCSWHVDRGTFKIVLPSYFNEYINIPYFLRYHQYFRMSPGQMEEVLSYVGEDITRCTTNFRTPIEPKQRLAVTIRYCMIY